MSDLAEQSIRELSAEIGQLRADLAAERERTTRQQARAVNAETERDELLETLSRIESKLVASNESLSAAVLDALPPSTASGRPVERFTHDVKWDKL